MVLRWVDGDRSELGRSRFCRIGQDEGHTQRLTVCSTQRVEVALVQIRADLSLGISQKQKRHDGFALRTRSNVFKRERPIFAHGS
jgi:hypothetical protein